MNGFNEDEREQRKTLVYSNTVRCMSDILNAMPLFGIHLANKQLEVINLLTREGEALC